MEKKEHLTTIIGAADIYVNPNVCKMWYHPGKLDSLEDVKKSTLIALDFFKEKDIPPMPFLSDIREIKGASKEVRDYLADNELTPYIQKIAILVNSGLSKIIGNIFLRFSGPKYPAKIFTNESKAMEWLLSE